MLTLYRRHTKACGQKDRYYRRCKCPMWVEGTIDAGEYKRGAGCQSCGAGSKAAAIHCLTSNKFLV
jgi:hypothetical protein